jgi:hypothetical protein
MWHTKSEGSFGERENGAAMAQEVVCQRKLVPPVEGGWGLVAGLAAALWA